MLLSDEKSINKRRNYTFTLLKLNEDLRKYGIALLSLDHDRPPNLFNCQAAPLRTHSVNQFRQSNVTVSTPKCEANNQMLQYPLQNVKMLQHQPIA